MNSAGLALLLQSVKPAPTPEKQQRPAKPVGALLAGLGVFMLAEVFAYGLSLREDVEGTI